MSAQLKALRPGQIASARSVIWAPRALAGASGQAQSPGRDELVRLEVVARLDTEHPLLRSDGADAVGREVQHDHVHRRAGLGKLPIIQDVGDVGLDTEPIRL